MYVSVYVRVRALVLTWTALVGDFDEFLLIRARISLAVATGRSQKLAVAFLLARFHHVLQQRILWESMHKGFFDCRFDWLAIMRWHSACVCVCVLVYSQVTGDISVPISRDRWERVRFSSSNIGLMPPVRYSHVCDCVN